MFPITFKLVKGHDSGNLQSFSNQKYFKEGHLCMGSYSYSQSSYSTLLTDPLQSYPLRLLSLVESNREFLIDL